MAKFHQPKKKNLTIGNGIITVNAIIGNAQAGYIEVYTWPHRIATGKGSVTAVCGHGSELKNKMLRIESLARDVNTASDKVVLYIIIKEDGNEILREPHSEKTTDGETVMFDIQIQLQ